MSTTDPEILLVLEGCEDIKDLAPFVMVVQAGKFPLLKKALNSKLLNEDGKSYSELLSEVEKGNASELVGRKDLLPLLMNAVAFVANQSQ